MRDERGAEHCITLDAGDTIQGTPLAYYYAKIDPITVGIVGLVTPGVSVWDKNNVAGKLWFNGIVEQAKVVIPQVKKAGAVVVRHVAVDRGTVLAHRGHPRR